MRADEGGLSQSYAQASKLKHLSIAPTCNTLLLTVVLLLRHLIRGAKRANNNQRYPGTSQKERAKPLKNKHTQ